MPRQPFEQHFDALVTIGASMALLLPLAAERIVSSGRILCPVSLSVGRVDDQNCICMPSEHLGHRILVLKEIRWTPEQDDARRKLLRVESVLRTIAT